MRYIIFFCFLFIQLFSFNAKSQSISDSSEVITLYKKAQTKWLSDPDSSLILSLEALNLAKKINYTRGVIKSYTSLGTIFYYKEEQDSARYYWTKSKNLAEQNHYSKEVIRNLSNLSLIHVRNEEYLKFIELNDMVLQKKLEDLRGRKDSISLAGTLNNVGNTLVLTKNYKRSVEYFEKAIQIYLATKHPANLARTYANLGETYLYMNQLDKAEKTLNRSLQLSEEHDDLRSDRLAITNLATLNLKKNNFDKAFLLYDSARNIYKSFTKILAVNETTRMMNIRLKQKRHNDVLGLSKQIQKQILNSKLSNKSEYYKVLAQTYQEKKNYIKSSSYWKKYVTVKDSLDELNNRNTLQKAEIELYFRFKETEAKIEAARRESALLKNIEYEQNLNYILLGFSTLTVLLIIIILRSYFIIKKNNKNLETQSDTIHSLLEQQKALLDKKGLELVSSKKIIDRYAFLNSHELRAPIAKLLALLNLIDREKINQQDFIDLLSNSIMEIDHVVRKIAKELDN